MKIKLLYPFILTISIWTIYSFTSKKYADNVIITHAELPQDYLILFGEQVFKREGCTKCHSLQITDKTKISLDGLKGKYPVSWHLNHLIDPTSMVPNSEMPSYIHLMDKLFKRDSIEKYFNTISQQEWKQVISNANSIKNELKEFGIDIKSNTDIVALIHFIENIPQTEECKLIRNKEIEKAIRENKIKDSIWATSETDIQVAINDPNNFTKGQSIFKANCTACHGINGEGIIGPNLTDEFWLNGGKDSNILNSILKGIPDKGMRSWKNELSPVEAGQIVCYIKALIGTNPPNAKNRQGQKD